MVVDRGSALIAVLLLVAVLATLPAETRADGTTTPILTVPDRIDGTAVFAALAPDAIRAIDDPAFLRGEAAASSMTEDEPVLGVRLDGEARAYPLGFLSAHEIVNDRFGDVAVAVTW
jgi:hypothetical protein